MNPDFPVADTIPRLSVYAMAGISFAWRVTISPLLGSNFPLEANVDFISL